MSELLKMVYASAPSGAVVIYTLELSHAAFSGGAIRIAQGFDDLLATLETGETVLFEASGFGVSLPPKSIRGRQDLQFRLDNVTGRAIREIDKAREAGGPIKVVLRSYLSSDLSAPAVPPVVMTGESVKANVQSVTAVATFHDLVNKAWPRRRYTPDFAPGLKYFD